MKRAGHTDGWTDGWTQMPLVKPGSPRSPVKKIHTVVRTGVKILVTEPLHGVTAKVKRGKGVKIPIPQELKLEVPESQTSKWKKYQLFITF